MSQMIRMGKLIAGLLRNCRDRLQCGRHKHDAAPDEADGPEQDSVNESFSNLERHVSILSLKCETNRQFILGNLFIAFWILRIRAFTEAALSVSPRSSCSIA